MLHTGYTLDAHWMHTGCTLAARCHRYVPMFGDVHYDSLQSYSSVPLEQQAEALQDAVQQGACIASMVCLRVALMQILVCLRVALM